VLDPRSSPQRYEIVIRGRLSRRFGGALDGVWVEPGVGETQLHADVADQSQLYGLLNRLRDFGIELVSVNSVAEVSDAR
jgi:hypothetical protein